MDDDGNDVIQFKQMGDNGVQTYSWTENCDPRRRLSTPMYSIRMGNFVSFKVPTETCTDEASLQTCTVMMADGGEAVISEFVLAQGSDCYY